MMTTTTSDSDFLDADDEMPYSETDSGKIKPAEEARVAIYLVQRYKDQIAYDRVSQSFWVYSEQCNGKWIEISDDRLKQLICDELDDSLVKGLYSFKYVDGIAKLLRIKLGVDGWKEAKGLIPCRNGVLNLETGELLPHDPNYWFRWQLPYDFNPTISAKPIVDWLLDTFDSNAEIVEVVRAYMYCTLLGLYEVKKFAELIGATDAGKSLLSRLIQALIGSENTVSTTLGRITGRDSRFEFARYIGKRLVVVSETETHAENFNIIKSLTGGDLLTIERKGKDVNTKGYTYEGLLLFVGNEPIKFPAKDKALLERRILIPFTKTIPKSQQRPLLDIKDEIPTGEFVPYLPGLLNWVLSVNPQEAIDLIKHGYKSGLQQSQRELLRESNPMIEWMETYCTFQPAAETPVGKYQQSSSGTHLCDWQHHLFPSYMTFAREQGYDPKASLMTFSTSLINFASQYFGVALTKKRKNTGFVITGISLKPIEYQGLVADTSVGLPEKCRPGVDPSVDFKPLPGADCVGCVGLNEESAYRNFGSLDAADNNRGVDHAKSLHSLHDADTEPISTLHQPYTNPTLGLHQSYTGITPPTLVEPDSSLKIGDRVKTNKGIGTIQKIEGNGVRVDGGSWYSWFPFGQINEVN